MVYRETSAQDVTSQRATLSPFSIATLLSLDRITGGKALSSLHPQPPVTRARRTKLSSTLSTHSIRNAVETARADAFETNASCLSSLVFGAVGAEVARIDIRKANRKRQRVGNLGGKYFEVF